MDAGPCRTTASAPGRPPRHPDYNQVSAAGHDSGRPAADGRGPTVSTSLARDPAVEPGLEGQHVPQFVGQITPPLEVLVPRPPYGGGIEQTLVSQAALIEQLLGPRA